LPEGDILVWRDRFRRFRIDLQATRAIGGGNAPKAVALLSDLEKEFGLSAVQEAQLATALLRSGRSQFAQRRFASLQEKLAPEDRYIQKYCRYYLALMRDERSQADYEWRLAQATPHSRRIRKRLPMSRVAEKARPGVVATFSLGDTKRTTG
jgi:hypothetical protein